MAIVYPIDSDYYYLWSQNWWQLLERNVYTFWTCINPNINVYTPDIFYSVISSDKWFCWLPTTECWTVCSCSDWQFREDSRYVTNPHCIAAIYHLNSYQFKTYVICFMLFTWSIHGLVHVDLIFDEIIWELDEDTTFVLLVHFEPEDRTRSNNQPTSMGRLSQGHLTILFIINFNHRDYFYRDLYSPLYKNPAKIKMNN